VVGVSEGFLGYFPGSLPVHLMLKTLVLPLSTGAGYWRC